MKIGGIQSFTLSDYPGYCAAIIFTIGCNFRCPYCHNKSLCDESAAQITEKEIMDFLITKQGKLDGVVITGGEPTIQTDLENFIQKIKELNYIVKLDTNGSYPNVLTRLITKGLLDYIAMDIKAPFSIYDKLAGTQVSISAIYHSIKIIASSGIEHVFRTTWDKKLLTEYDISVIKSLLPAGSKFITQKCTPINCEL
ncbi:MAG: anaerobic ribonucleoside-triphosphate reductase activating protein [Gammaproteobacteria bacterium]|jgi:pyruvate formate lyase activating enzyme